MVSDRVVLAVVDLTFWGLLTCSQAGCYTGAPMCLMSQIPSARDAFYADANNCGPFSTDLVGGSDTYPEAPPAERRDIWRRHRDYVLGLMYTLATDGGVPESLRARMAQWGLCGDQFADSGYFPPALYVRSARRMVSDVGKACVCGVMFESGVSQQVTLHDGPFLHLISVTKLFLQLN